MNAAMLVVAAVVQLTASEAVEVNPIGKVIQMISELEVKVIGEGEHAQKLYKFAEFCEDKSRDLGFAIKTGKSEAAELKATIQDQSAKIEAETTKIDELSASISTDEADLSAATKIRETEHADFLVEEKELVDVIDTLGRATGILEKEMAKGAASMLQMRNVNSIADALKVMVEASALNSDDASKLTALVQSSQTSEDSDEGAPDAAVYESKSGNIVETLQGLQDKAETQLDEARKKESTSAHNFDMLKQSLTDSIKFANEDMAAAKQARNEAEEKKKWCRG
jgi:hypothetical protein